MFKEELTKIAKKERQNVLTELKKKADYTESMIFQSQDIAEVCFLSNKYQNLKESIETIEKEIEEEEKEEVKIK